VIVVNNGPEDTATTRSSGSSSTQGGQRVVRGQVQDPAAHAAMVHEREEETAEVVQQPQDQQEQEPRRDSNPRNQPGSDAESTSEEESPEEGRQAAPPTRAPSQPPTAGRKPVRQPLSKPAIALLAAEAAQKRALEGIRKAAANQQQAGNQARKAAAAVDLIDIEGLEPVEVADGGNHEQQSLGPIHRVDEGGSAANDPSVPLDCSGATDPFSGAAVETYVPPANADLKDKVSTRVRDDVSRPCSHLTAPAPALCPASTDGMDQRGERHAGADPKNDHRGRRLADGHPQRGAGPAAAAG